MVRRCVMVPNLKPALHILKEPSLKMKLAGVCVRLCHHAELMIKLQKVPLCKKWYL